MNIAIIGYGKMGQSVEAIATQRGHTITHKLRSADTWTSNDLEGADAAIEFTEPEAAVESIFKCFEARVPVVVGTTGWYDRYHEVEDAARSHNGTLLHATNFSLGVNIFFEINRQLARVMNRYPAYDITMQETHHTEKLDAPSGTAITLAKDVLSAVDRKSSYNQTGEESFPIDSVREANVPGTHVVSWDSDIDQLELKHTAKNRHGFASGAVVAAEWLQGKNGIYTMKDLLNFS